MTEAVLRHVAVASYLIAFALGWFAHTRQLVRAGGFVAFGVGVSVSIAGAMLASNGHDWSDDSRTAERLLGALAALGAFVLLCASGRRHHPSA
ncbi:hypothetical protein ACV22V_30595 [Burkholderia sp. AW33-5]